ncbi:MAG: trypsin-like peptidase domain-containing protein [Prevotella sp.]|nr:trypsin-like peptidase domain-containing protein [Prevotella sp.]
MDNNFDENIAAEPDNGGGTTGDEVRADTERRGDFGKLPDAAPTVQPAAEPDDIGAVSANSVQQETAGSPFGNTQNAQNIQPGQFGQPVFPSAAGAQPFDRNAGNAPQYVPPRIYGEDFRSQQNQYGQYGQQNPEGQPIGGNYPPSANQPRNGKRFSGGCFWALVSAIAVMFAAVVVLAVKIAAGTPDSGKAPESGNIGKYENFAETQKAEYTIVEIPAADKPILDDVFYADKESGLLTSVGVARTILPSQVKIKVFDDMPYAPVSSGSGIILTEDGYILTNAHVVDGAKRLSVGFYEDGESEAVIVGIDKKSDLAVIKVDKAGLSPAQIGKSSSLEIGEEVALAGAGGGFENTVTYGHVTGLGREIDTDYISSSTIRCIQSDAALNPGNSGGALVNMYGQVVGVAVALMNHETYENIGFCIAIDDAVPIAEDLIAHGYVSSRTRVGITYMSIGDAAASGYGIPAGLCVMDIDPLSGAAFAGLKPYDVITHIDGHRVFGAGEISDALADKRPGDVITISVFRKEITGETGMFDAKLELVADTSSVSGYSVTEEDEDFMNRDIVK